MQRDDHRAVQEARDSEPKLYGLDIETDTTSDGLDPSIGGVIAVAVSVGDDVAIFDDADEASLLTQLDAFLKALPAGVLVTWNGARFDLPYLATRADIVGVTLGLHLELGVVFEGLHEPLPGHAGAYRASWFQHDHLDAYLVYRADVGPALGLSCRLKTLASLVGLEPVEVDAGRVHELTAAELSAYVGSDARCTAELARRRWVTARRWVDALENRPSLSAPAIVASSVTGDASDHVVEFSHAEVLR
ncbi:MAG: 3'-5' exonuclease [Actinomycetes bacterium]